MQNMKAILNILTTKIPADDIKIDRNTTPGSPNPLEGQ